MRVEICMLHYQVNPTPEGFCHSLNLKLKGINLIQKTEAFVANRSGQEFMFQNLVELEDDLHLGDGGSFRCKCPTFLPAGKFLLLGKPLELADGAECHRHDGDLSVTVFSTSLSCSVELFI